jgi:hypothetical protein
MMVDTVIRGMLGTWGKPSTIFTCSTAIYINAALMIYAVLIVPALTT